MKINNLFSVTLFIIAAGLICFQGFSCRQGKKKAENSISTVRFATFNTSLFRDEAGGLIHDLSDRYNIQACNVAEIIQIVRPDVIALLEFDYDQKGKGLKLFRKNYLSRSQSGHDPIDYPYAIAIPSNTGIPTELDLNHDGQTGGPEDAFGFGRFPGQYAFAILSKYPLKTDEMRTFQHFLWKDMPGALLPLQNDSISYYSDEVIGIFRLSSKNHIDLPVEFPSVLVHLLIAHPTPPAFHGDEDRNGRRNHDEIRLFKDYITGDSASMYLYDDQGRHGGIPESEYFVIMGDMNADPVDGDSYDHAIRQLIFHPAVNIEASQGFLVPSSEGSFDHARSNPEASNNNKGNPWYDTSVWGLRIDYIMPSAQLMVTKSGVFWPETADPNYYLIKDQAASDHMLVWMDIKMPQVANISSVKEK